jgi:hypothetical protein
MVFAAYSLLFLLAPDFTMDTIFGWENQPTLWVRGVGIPFAGLAWAEWLVAARLESRLDLVWPFVLVPGLFAVVFIWERTVETYEGTDLFYWMSMAVSVFFFLAVGGFRLAAAQTRIPTTYA